MIPKEEFSVDSFLDRRMLGDRYNCAHFASEVWTALTGESLGNRLEQLLAKIDSRRPLVASNIMGFTSLSAPQDPCFVVMRRPRAATHVGVYLRGRVLHLQHNGVEFMELEVASRGFTRTRFYK